MALDTADKRSSAVFVGSPWRGKLPFPDSSVGAGDRQVVAFQYSGIEAAVVAAPASGLATIRARAGNLFGMKARGGGLFSIRTR